MAIRKKQEQIETKVSQRGTAIITCYNIFIMYKRVKLSKGLKKNTRREQKKIRKLKQSVSLIM